MAGNDLSVGGLGLGQGYYDLPSNVGPLSVSPDLAFNPTTDTGMGSIYRGMYNPLAPIGVMGGLARPAEAPSSNFDIAFGDSIAGQQISSNTPGVGNRRIWGWLGPQYNARNPAPFNVWETAGVGDPPQRILDRAKYALSQNPNFFRGKNVFSPIGSNDTSQMDAVREYLQLLKDNGAANVVVPGLGPKVQGGEAANAALKKLTEDAGFTFFTPQVQWAGDGVHPNSKQMFDQASQVLNARMAATAPKEEPQAPGPPVSLLPPPPSTAPNALSPAPAYTPYTG